MVVHYTLQRPNDTGKGGKEPKESSTHSKQASKSDHYIEASWWAAQVASNKEYDTKREILNTCNLKDEDVLIPRRMVYGVKDDELDKKTEMVLPGYLLLRLGSLKILQGLGRLSNYISIIGKVSPDEMGIVEEYEDIPKEGNANVGDKIIVIRGPFAGVKGVIIEELDGGFSKCRLMFQGNEIVTNMKRRIVEKIS